MKAGHTPGPWRMTTNGTKARIEKGTFSPAWIIATVEPKDGKLIAPSEDLANARLIAAAPELLEALKLVVMSEYDRDEESRNFEPDTLEEFEKLLEKAGSKY